MKPKCMVVNKDGYHIGWEHEWKVIYKEVGNIHGFLLKKDVVIFHQQCRKCGILDYTILKLPCQKCRK